MIGHEALIAMRRAGRVPRAVWILDGEDVRARDWHEEVNCCDRMHHACISVGASDIPEALDLRCVIGLEVHLCGDRGEARLRRLHAALVDAGAARVITAIPSAVDLLLHGVPEHV